jgi:hypothetical protein
MDDEGFELPVMYKGAELQFPARLIRFGYSYKIEVDVNGTSIAYEPDEERNWRALMEPEFAYGNKRISLELLQAIAVSLEAITK